MSGDIKELVLNSDWCTGCGLCAAFCPQKVLEVQHEKAVIVNQKDCIRCGLCELRCPDYAIFLREAEQ